jgi:uncharacterized phage protein (TIGR02218 family)
MTPALEAALRGEVTTVALCWRLVRPDGVSLGFTGHDRDLRFGGLDYLARPGMMPSAVSLSGGYTEDSMEVTGVLSADSISAADLDAGRWTGAAVELIACDWMAPETGTLRLMRGRIGDVMRDGGPGGAEFRVELVSDMARLSVAGAPRCSPLCRAELGDARCTVDMGGRQQQAIAAGGSGAQLVLAAAPADGADYVLGRLRVLSGPLAGVDRRIADVQGAEIGLDEPLWGGAIAGSRVLLVEGCDKRFRTCVDRFSNGAAFDGEPHVPGVDALIRYVA